MFICFRKSCSFSNVFFTWFCCFACNFIRRRVNSTQRYPILQLLIHVFFSNSYKLMIRQDDPIHGTITHTTDTINKYFFKISTTILYYLSKKKITNYIRTNNCLVGMLNYYNTIKSIKSYSFKTFQVN